MKEVIIALDFPERESTIRFLKRFADARLSPYVKVGMELFYAEGASIVREIADLGLHIFLDLKAHDIPNTVRGAMASLSRLPIDIVNVHASGGLAMMRAAREAFGENEKRPLIIGVTILTSISSAQMNDELGILVSAEDAAARLAILAKQAGLDGVVCSPAEVPRVHAECGERFLTVTPGVRFQDADASDQQRVVTPSMAHELGSDFIVVGRPITRAAEAVSEYRRYMEAFCYER